MTGYLSDRIQDNQRLCNGVFQRGDLRGIGGRWACPGVIGGRWSDFHRHRRGQVEVGDYSPVFRAPPAGGFAVVASNNEAGFALAK